MNKLLYEDLTYKIRGAFFEVFKNLGPGFKEIVYQNALKDEFERLNIGYQEKERIKIFYKNKQVGIYEPDFIIEEKIIVEIKAVDIMPRVFENQLFSYLKATKYKIGMLVNFGASKLEVRRRIYG
ncbi:MAG: GxxExxY protein [Endomicrobiales bacterium]|nr:GxxExxY protein [Endomicrobiales bacterium]